MKKLLFALGLALGFATNLPASETLRLKLEPDRKVLLAGSPQEVVVKIDLSAVADKKKLRRTPLNLAVVLDRSGSMSGAKIEKARQAAMELVDRLAPNDIFSLVVYSDRAEVLLPAQRVENKEALKRKIERLTTGGSTALHAGVTLGAGQLEENLSSKRINRVILLSDGLANVGPSSTSALRRLGHNLSERGIAVTTIGLGDDYNEDLMAGLAEASDANYYYVQDTEKLPQIFAKELGELLNVAAREVRIEIICPDGVRPIEFIGRPEKFENQRAMLRLNQFAAGQDRYVFLRCKVNDDSPEIARVNVSYRDELNEGLEVTAHSTLNLTYSADKDIVARSLQSDVVAQKELLLTAVAKDAALFDADAGRYADAAATLSRQAAVLADQAKNAPAALQPQIRLELENIRNRSSELQQGYYDNATRKAMQSESYNTRNSK